MFIKNLKRTVFVLAAMLVAATSVSAQDYSIPAELASYGEEIYEGARSYFGRSFNGYCGTYVRCQLRAMGIFKNKFDFRGNGNQWYSNFENTDVTSGGYYVYREAGADCIDNLVDKYGDNLGNIVLSFPIQAGYSAAYPGAGHALVIYRLSDGVAYYSESFPFGDKREGEVIAENVNALVERYSRRHGNPIGCVLLSKDNLSADLSYEAQGIVLAEVAESMENLSSVTFVAMKFTEIPHYDTLA